MTKRSVKCRPPSWRLRQTVLVPLIISLALIGPVSVQAAPTDYAALVDPFIGTAGPGHTLPGAVVPWGMVYISPDTSPERPADRASGYLSGDPYLLGFSQVHTSGFGCADFGNILITPTVGNVATADPAYRSTYDAEQASPGYYRVHLRTPDVVAEMTTTARATFSRFTYPARSGGDANILIDVTHTLSPDVDGGSVAIVSTTEIDGWARTGHRCDAHNLQTVYFVARFSKPAVSGGTWNGSRAGPASSQQGTHIGAYFRYTTAANEAIGVKIGISYVSIANARLNLDTEIPAGKTFDQVQADAHAAWNTQLAKIAVTGGTPDQQTIFYTALYHTLLHPSIFSDVNGQYQGFGGSGVLTTNGYTRYHVFSTWDTYRGLHALLALVYPEREKDMIRTLVEISKESGWLPRWAIGENDTYGMVGDNAAVLIANAYLKGIKHIDIQAAYAAMKKNATQTANNPIRAGLGLYLEYGYIPKDAPSSSANLIWGPVSTSLEYYYDDWSIAQVAYALGGPAMAADEALFANRSLNYKKLYDPDTGFLRPRNADGSWMRPFDPTSQCCDQSWSDSGGPGYVEGSAWQYTFAVPHDIAGLKELMGGDARFTGKLQQAFDGGQYGLWNEPDFAYAYLFTYVPGQAWRTQRQVRSDLSNLFHRVPDGLPGNDDGGATSAVYVFGAIGFYPVSPASTRYQVGSPIFDTITIQLNAAYYPGGQFIIQASGNSSASPYIQSAALNGSLYQAAYLDHGQITNGGTFALTMGNQQTTWGSDAVATPLPPEE